jgi:hypothetical protein
MPPGLIVITSTHAVQNVGLCAKSRNEVRQKCSECSHWRVTIARLPIGLHDARLPFASTEHQATDHGKGRKRYCH